MNTKYIISLVNNKKVSEKCDICKDPIGDSNLYQLTKFEPRLAWDGEVEMEDMKNWYGHKSCLIMKKEIYDLIGDKYE